MPHFQKKMDLKLSVGVRYDAICIERLSQNRRTDRTLSPVSYENGMEEPSKSKHDGPLQS